MSNVTAISEPLPTPQRTSSIVTRDFPRWLPPMLVKELRQGLRTRGFVGTLLAFQVLMLVLTLVALNSQSAMSPGTRAASAALSGFFWVIVAVQLIFVTPSRALGGLQLEIDSRTIDLLMLTRLTAWRVVLGKWISLLAQATLLLIAMMPYMVVRYFTENADLVNDLGACLTMLVVCGVLTAAGLWGSGVARLVRILMGVALILVMGNVIGAIGAIFVRRSVGAHGGIGSGIDLPFDLLNAALIAAFFLVSAVRNIAPPAENHSLFARALPVLALLAAGLCELAGAHQLAVRQLYLSAVFAGFVLAFELGSSRTPMPTHWRNWHSRGPLSRFPGRLSMPGWPSAFLFGLVLTAAWIAVGMWVLAGASPTSVPPMRIGWMALLAFSGLTFPALIQSKVRSGAVPRVLLYFVALVVPILLSGLALALAESRWKSTGFRSVMEVMPVSSFLFAADRTSPTTAILVGQGVVALAILLGAGVQSRGYWGQLKTFEMRDREASRPAAVVP